MGVWEGRTGGDKQEANRQERGGYLGGLLNQIHTSLDIARGLEQLEQSLGPNDADGHVVVLCVDNVIDEGGQGGGGHRGAGNAGKQREGIRRLAAIVPAVVAAVDCPSDMSQ